MKVFTGVILKLNIYDIAKKAQVSIATVSRVLNNSDSVREETRRRILDIMREEGYVPNAFARGLGLNTMKMVGVMCTDITDSFYANAVGEIERLLRTRGLDTVLCCTGNEPSDKRQALESLVNRKVDAVILIGSVFREQNDNSHICTAASSVPVIIINGFVEAEGVYCVLCDERSAVRRCVSALYRQGGNKILYLYDTDTYSGIEKRRGYSEGCAETGLDEMCLKVKRNVDAVAEQVKKLLSTAKQPNAVIASEDIIAAGALKALYSRGVKIPVIGFNNSVIAECTTPSLTSVDNLCSSMCETAVRIISDIEKGKTISQKTVLSPGLFQRESFKTDNW